MHSFSKCGYFNLLYLFTYLFIKGCSLSHGIIPCSLLFEKIMTAKQPFFLIGEERTVLTALSLSFVVHTF